MFNLHAVQAQFGDAIILEFGTAKKRRYVLIDGGPPGSFDADLDAALGTIVGNDAALDLLVLSHVDNDHVIGVLDLLAAIEDDIANQRRPRLAIKGLWHNSFSRSLDPSGEITQRIQQLMTLAGSAATSMPLAADAFLGVREGQKLGVMARKLGIPINRGFPGGLILAETARKTIALGSLRLRVIGPSKANLDALRKEWLTWLAKAEAEAARDPKTAAMADRSVPNLSSIVLLAEFAGRTALLTGDARGDHIIEGLKRAGLLEEGGTCHVDVLKVQHHGSDRNTDGSFFRAVTAGTYVISANGKYGNPDYDTLRWIVEAADGRAIRLVVTNETDTTRKLRETHDPARHGYTMDILPEGQHSINVELTP